MFLFRLSLPTLVLLASRSSLAQESKFQPCPLLGPFFPAPLINASSPALHSAFEEFTTYIDKYVSTGNGTFGPITPNTTSFSIALFGGDNDINGDALPYFYEYHHGIQGAPLDAQSTFALGDVTQLFTVFTLLAELGGDVWDQSIVNYVPELMDISRNASSIDPIDDVNWNDVTLGALAGHMAGITRISDACVVEQKCERDAFLSSLAAKSPVYLPYTTPIFSQAAFQLLAIAIENNCKQSFSTILATRVIDKLNMTSTNFIRDGSKLFGGPLSNASIKGEQAALSLLSNIHDMALFGRSILTSSILTSATTRRWLKPFTSTSNLRNAVGRPWEIYHYSDESTDPITDIYTKTGSLGRYSSYFGIAPDYDVGFVILAVDSQGDAPDLNAYADMALAALLQIDSLARAEAEANLAGIYSNGNSTLTLNITGSNPGLAITRLVFRGTDWLSTIAERSNIDPQYLDFRLYPTNIARITPSGKQQVFRGVIQDKSALVDAGTPTCISWQTVDTLYQNGEAVDEFIIELDSSGDAIAIEFRALGIRLGRDDEK